MKKGLWIVASVVIISACQPATLLPPITAEIPLAPITAELGEVFALAPGQTASINGTNLVVTISGIPGDQRCPSEIECAMSGPVTIPITVQSGSGEPQEFILQTFTDNNGNVPEMDFEGMTTGIEVGGYAIQVKSVLPFPQKSVDEIGDGEYRVAFLVEK